MNIFQYGKNRYEYELIKENRKTLSLTVKPDLRTTLKCPINASAERIENFLRRKWSWLEKQLNYFRKHQKPESKKEFISGESIWYLGRQYKILVKSSLKNSISLDKKHFYIHSKYPVDETISNRLIVNTWIRSKRKDVFNNRFQEMKTRFDYKMTPKLVIRDMDKRWGSFISESKIVLNPKLIHVSTECIDYVIVHELCHVKYKNHSKKYYEFLSEKFPNWERVKSKLELSTT